MLATSKRRTTLFLKHLFSAKIVQIEFAVDSCYILLIYRSSATLKPKSVLQVPVVLKKSIRALNSLVFVLKMALPARLLRSLRGVDSAHTG